MKAADAACHHIVLRSKSDLPAVWERADAIAVSAVTGEGLPQLESAVAELYPADVSVPVGQLLTNPRQAEAVSRAHEYLLSALEALDSGVTPDAVLTELEGALNALAELSGRVVREDITNGIFARFCVGK